MTSRARLSATTAFLATLLALGPAHAAGLIVFDPTNYAQNALTAARELQAIQNQALQLANEAHMLARSPLSQTGEIGQALTRMNQIVTAVSGLSADATRLEQQFSQLFPSDVQGRSRLELVQQTLARLQAAKNTAQDLARVAADLTGRNADQARRIRSAMSASEGAAGQTAAIQSSTQLMGVLAEEMAGIQTVTAAQARMASTAAAQAAADQEAAAEAHRQLWAHEAAAPATPSFSPLPNASH